MTGEKFMGNADIFFKADTASDAGGAASKSVGAQRSNVSELLKNWHGKVDLLKRQGKRAPDARNGLKSVVLHPPAIKGNVS